MQTSHKTFSLLLSTFCESIMKDWVSLAQGDAFCWFLFLPIGDNLLSMGSARLLGLPSRLKQHWMRLTAVHSTQRQNNYTSFFIRRVNERLNLHSRMLCTLMGGGRDSELRRKRIRNLYTALLYFNFLWPVGMIL